MEFLINLDQSLLLFFNSFHTPLWDYFFWFYSGTITWIPLYAAILYVAVKELGYKSLGIIISIVLTIVLCDQIASGFFKPFFQRLRPSHEPSLTEQLHLLNGYRAGKFGFISSHAANSFGLATIITLLFRQKWLVIFFFLWAVLNSYSRIYLGLHYPADILVGALVGVASGWLVYKLYEWVALRFIFKDEDKNSLIIDSPSAKTITYTGGISIAVMFLSAWQLLKII